MKLNTRDLPRFTSLTHCALFCPIFQISPDQGSFEGRVVVVCEKMMSQPCWASSNQLVHSKNSRGMTLLHLAAAQGYAGLIQTLICWRWVTHKYDPPSWSFRIWQFICCLALQHQACRQYWPRAGSGSSQRRPLLLHSTGEWSIVSNVCLSVCFFPSWLCVTCIFLWPPQMWACALGHTEAALVLYQWDPRALAIPDSLGRLPLNIARSRGHTRLAELLEQLQQTPHAQGQPADTWMDRWRGESQLSGISNSPTPNSNSGGKVHQYMWWCDMEEGRIIKESVYPKHKEMFSIYSLQPNTTW